MAAVDSMNTLVIRNIPETIHPDSIAKKFEVYGKIKDFQVHRDHAYITFFYKSSAAMAMAGEQGAKIQHNILSVEFAQYEPYAAPAPAPEPVQPPQQHSVPVRRLCVKNCRPEVSKENLLDYFHYYGVHDAFKIGAKNLAFIDFLNPECAEAALVHEQGCLIKGVRIVLEYARPKQEQPEAASAHDAPTFKCDGARSDRVEILVLSEKVSSYAAGIRLSLGKLDIDCNLLHLPRKYPQSKVIVELTNAGTQFAVSVRPVDQMNCTLTLFKLQGQQEEFLAIPVEEAMKHILTHMQHSSSVPEKVQEVPVERRSQETAVRREKNAKPHPQDMNIILSFLRENRPLSVLEYQKLIKYVKEKMKEAEEKEAGKKNIERVKAELMNILGGQIMRR